MISAWELYFILQMDSIGTGICGLGLAAGTVALVYGFAGALMRDSYNSEHNGKWERGVKVHKTTVKLGVLAAALLFTSSFIPSTRTLAAMVVVPAIVNNTAVQKEAGELYQLAKQALANAVSDDDAPVKKAPAETDSD